MAVKKKKKTSRKKTSKIIEQSNTSNKIIEKIKANPLIILIGIAIVVGIGIFIYSSQQGTQIALNKCINKNLNSELNSNISEHLIIKECIEKNQQNISTSSIRISVHKNGKREYNDNCLLRKLTGKDLKRLKEIISKETSADRKWNNLSRWTLSTNHPECTKMIYDGTQDTMLVNDSKFLVTEVEYISDNKKDTIMDMLNPGDFWDFDNRKIDKIIKVKGVKIKLK